MHWIAEEADLAVLSDLDALHEGAVERAGRGRRMPVGRVFVDAHRVGEHRVFEANPAANQPHLVEKRHGHIADPHLGSALELTDKRL